MHLTPFIAPISLKVLNTEQLSTIIIEKYSYSLCVHCRFCHSFLIKVEIDLRATIWKSRVCFGPRATSYQLEIVS